MNIRHISPLYVTLAASIAVHAGLLTLRLVDLPAFNRLFEDTPLEVILVNARSETAPEKAQAIAQAALAGGGEADAGRATSPLPPSEVSEAGDSVSTAENSMLQKMQEMQNMLLSSVRHQMAALPPESPKNAVDKAVPGPARRKAKATGTFAG